MASLALESVKSPALSQLRLFGMHPYTQVFASGKRRAEAPANVEKFEWQVSVRTTVVGVSVALNARRTG